MGKHSSGGRFGSGEDRPAVPGSRRPEGLRAPIPADRVLTSESTTPLQDAPPRRAGIESAPARLRAERERRRRRTQRIMLVAVLVVVLVAAAGAVAVAAYVGHLSQVITVQDKEKLQVDLAKSEPGQPFNILLLGADYRKGDTAYRTDTIIVARIDPQQKKFWMISIPRDTRVLIPGHGYSKINAAHTYGGPDLTLKTVQGFTGLPISHYMEVNFQGFEDAVNAMGGVWVNVPQAIDDKKAASSSVHQRAAVISAGYQKLDGEHALTLVRSRDGYLDQDVSRMKVQQVFFRAVADQLAKSTDIPKTIRVVNAITPYIQTDMNVMDLLKTALDMKGAGSKNMYTATLNGPWKSPFIYTDPVMMANIVSAFKAGRPFTKAMDAAVVKVPDATASTPTTGGVIPASVKITIKNGAGTSGWGSQAATLLKSKGFVVKSVGNANQSIYKKTLVIYKTKLASAQAVAAALMPGTTIVQNRGLYSSPTEILVVIGKDWDMTKIPAAPVTQ
jgi:LCP family protein required for cell wall assembly